MEITFVHKWTNGDHWRYPCPPTQVKVPPLCPPTIFGRMCAPVSRSRLVWEERGCISCKWPVLEVLRRSPTDYHFGHAVPGVLDGEELQPFKGISCATLIKHIWYRHVSEFSMIQRSRKPLWSHLLLSISSPRPDDLRPSPIGASRLKCSRKGNHSLFHGVIWVFPSECMVLTCLRVVTGGTTSTM